MKKGYSLQQTVFKQLDIHMQNLPTYQKNKSKLIIDLNVRAML